MTGRSVGTTYGIVDIMPEEYGNEGSENADDSENLERPPAFFPYSGSGMDRERASQPDLVEVQLEGVYTALNAGQQAPFVVLTDGDRKLDIQIGPFEAHAIVAVLEGKLPDRPLTHDLLKSVIERFEAYVHRVAIDDLWNGVYYAKIYFRWGKDEIEVDARPSDAVALALRFDAPIFVSDKLLISV